MYSVTVEPLIFLYMVAIDCEYTLIQYSISASHCLLLNNLTDPSACESPKSASIYPLIKDEVTRSMKYYNLALSLCCSVAIMFTGFWSDRYGRLFPMKFAILSSMAAQTFCAFFWLTLDTNSIWLIYIAGLVSGVSGSSSNLIANCFGYSADITSTADRSRAMAIMEAMLYLGNAIGFSTGSFMIKFVGNRLAIGFSILFLIHTSLLLYTSCYLKESKPSTEAKTLSGLFRLSHLSKVFRTILRPRSQPHQRFWLITIVTCAFIATLGSNSLSSILYLFLRNDPLNWNSQLYGYLQTSNYLLGGFTLLILVPLAQRFSPRPLSDDFTALLGFTSRVVGLILLGLSRTNLHAFLSPLGFIFSELTLPSLRSAVSKIVDPDEKGKAFAFLGLLSNLTFLIGSQLSNFIYKESSSRFPGLVLVLLGLLETIPAFIFLIKFTCFRNVPTPFLNDKTSTSSGSESKDNEKSDPESSANESN